MKTRFFLASALLLSAPLAVILPGCGGGSSSAPTQDFSSTLILPPSQSGTIFLSVSGASATGTLIVSGTASGASLPEGAYPFSGTASSTTFNVSGTIPSVGLFTIQGHLPSSSEGGDYTLMAGTETVGGSF